MSRPISKSIRAKRRAVAEKMNAANALLSPTQKLAKLDARLGVGVGATKERARLARQIEEAKNPKAKATEKPAEVEQETEAPVPKKAYQKGKKLSPA